MPIEREARIIYKDYLVDDLSKIVPIIKRDVANEIKRNVLIETRAQRELGNEITSMEVDGIRVSGKGGQFTDSTVKNIIKDADFRVKTRYGQDTSELLKAFDYTWERIRKKASGPFKRGTGESWRTYYARGRTTDFTTGNKKYTGKMSYKMARYWIKQQKGRYVGISIEGPQTPYRRKFLYIYANRKKVTEKIKQRGISTESGKPIFDERAEFRPSTSRFTLIKGRHRERYETYAYKAFMKTIRIGLKRKFPNLVTGYGFVPIKPGEKLKAYPDKATGTIRPWGEYLPRIFIGTGGIKVKYEKR